MKSNIAHCSTVVILCEYTFRSESSLKNPTLKAFISSIQSYCYFGKIFDVCTWSFSLALTYFTKDRPTHMVSLPRGEMLITT